ncbi:MAG: histidine kinase, partial [Aeriscardovia sp.]|nr:histidine kinase [Aeriscardovia sp.]
ICIRALREGPDLKVSITDDGIGLGKLPPSGGSLGMKIVETFVKVDFQGSILWSAAHGGGTKVELSIKLNGAMEGA